MSSMNKSTQMILEKARSLLEDDYLVPQLEQETQNSVSEIFSTLEAQGFWHAIGHSETLRDPVVTAQGLIEAALVLLAERQMPIGIIHTPKVPTPLRQLGTQMEPTVRLRRRVLMRFLAKSQGELWCCFSDALDTLEAESYGSLLRQYPESLFDGRLKLKHFEPEMIGATWFSHLQPLPNTLPQELLFSMRFRQLGDVGQVKAWICLGHTGQSEVRDSAQSALRFLHSTLPKETWKRLERSVVVATPGIFWNLNE